MTPEDYEQMLVNQNGVCAICGKPETATYHGKLMPLHIDHDHMVGEVRGLLCRRCNIKLGYLEDMEFVLKARLYLVLHGN